MSAARAIQTMLKLSPAIILLVLPACATVGPDYEGAPSVAPIAAQRATFLREDLSTNRALPAAKWWTLLDDPLLTSLVEAGLKSSPTIAAARARIAQSRAGFAAQRTGSLPTLGGSVSMPYADLPADIIDTSPRSERIDVLRYSAGIDASWELDLFGVNQRKTESAAARAEAALAQLADAQVSLSAEIVRVYCALRLQQERIALLEKQVGIDQKLFALDELRFKHGRATQHTVARARSQLAGSRSDLAVATAQFAALSDQLAVLIGGEPGSLESVLPVRAAIPIPPPEVAVGDPSQLLRHRPDIRIAERQLAAANAQIGVAIGERFPKVRFFGLLGMGGDSPADLMAPADLIGIALPRISWNLFDGGRADARIEASRAAMLEQEAIYRGTVLAALADAEASLSRFGAARIRFAAAMEAQQSAERIAELEAMRAEAGRLDLTSALGAERAVIQAQLAKFESRALLTNEFILVQKALGLGWEREKDFD